MCSSDLFARPTMDDAAAYGIGGIEITGRAGEGSMNPLAVATTDIPFLTAFNAGTESDLTYIVGDTNSTVLFDLPKVQFTNLTPGDRSGTRIFDLPFKVVREDGDDEIEITVTAVA